MPEILPQPAFLKEFGAAYKYRKKNVGILSGNSTDIFWCAEEPSRFIPLEARLFQWLKNKFHVVLRVDLATGINFFDPSDSSRLFETMQSNGELKGFASSATDLEHQFERQRSDGLTNLVTLEKIMQRVGLLRQVKPEQKPICVILQFAGSMFPSGDFDRLSEPDRGRLVFFLNWINSPLFRASGNLLILISSTQSEVNERILRSPVCCPIEISLPTEPECKAFLDSMAAKAPEDGRIKLEIEGGTDEMARVCAGLKLIEIEDACESAIGARTPLTKKLILKEVNARLRSELGDIVTVKVPTHGPDDVVGNAPHKVILEDIFERCEDPETAVSAMLIPGPNGGGKTFLAEAFAGASGRIVVELTGLRGKYFGQTDQLFERLRWVLTTFGRVLILVDEADTAFGSARGDEVHETEKRLSGNIIKLMGDPALLGKIVWCLMTSRPDKLAPDILRRAPIQIPVLDPQGEDRKEFIAGLFKWNKVPISSEELSTVFDKTPNFSASDFRDFIREIKSRQKRATRLTKKESASFDEMAKTVLAADLALKKAELFATKKAQATVIEVLKRYRPSNSILLERRFQTYVAAKHCAYPELLPLEPENLREMTPDELQGKIDALLPRIKH